MLEREQLAQVGRQIKEFYAATPEQAAMNEEAHKWLRNAYAWRRVMVARRQFILPNPRSRNVEEE